MVRPRNGQTIRTDRFCNWCFKPIEPMTDDTPGRAEIRWVDGSGRSTTHLCRMCTTRLKDALEQYRLMMDPS